MKPLKYIFHKMIILPNSPILFTLAIYTWMKLINELGPVEFMVQATSDDFEDKISEIGYFLYPYWLRFLWAMIFYSILIQKFIL